MSSANRLRERSVRQLKPLITVAMEPGSGGSVMVQKISERLDFSYFHRDNDCSKDGSSVLHRYQQPMAKAGVRLIKGCSAG